MPYIAPESRLELDVFVNGLIRELRLRGFVPGEMNYVITRLMHASLGEHPSYDRFNDAIGVLQCAQLELYRRKVVPYEDTKIDLNGDVT